jgi:hypothetical protein
MPPLAEQGDTAEQARQGPNRGVFRQSPHRTSPPHAGSVYAARPIQRT